MPTCRFSRRDILIPRGTSVMSTSRSYVRNTNFEVHTLWHDILRRGLRGICNSNFGKCNYILPDIAKRAGEYSAIKNKSKEYRETTISSSADTGANYNVFSCKSVLENVNMPQNQLNPKDVCPHVPEELCYYFVSPHWYQCLPT